MSVKFKRVVTGYRCHELNCYELGVWYVETESDFFHWCPKHAVGHMADRGFWMEKLAPSAWVRDYAERTIGQRRRRKPARTVDQ